MTIFDEATAVSRRADGRYDTQPDVRFALVVPGAATPPAVNGGALLAAVLRAVLSESPHPHPVATSAHFLRVPKLAPAEVEVTWLKHGGTAATARAALVQDGKIILDTTITTGTVLASPAAEGLDWTGPPPGFPAIENCVDLGRWPGTVAADGTAGYAGQVEVLMDPTTTGWRQGEPSGQAEMRGYFRLREDRVSDALLLAMAVDGLPPVVFELGATGWAPTVELTMHMRAVPAPGPLAVQTVRRHVSGGWFDEEAEVWDSAGRRVAQSRQLARVGRGPQRARIGGMQAAVVSG